MDKTKIIQLKVLHEKAMVDGRYFTAIVNDERLVGSKATHQTVISVFSEAVAYSRRFATSVGMYHLELCGLTALERRLASGLLTYHSKETLKHYKAMQASAEFIKARLNELSAVRTAKEVIELEPPKIVITYDL